LGTSVLISGIWYKPPLSPAAVERVVEMTLAEPPGETTHWTCRAMAKAAGVSHRSVQRIWAAHGPKPHRVKTFKLSNDPKFAAKVQDVVGLYIEAMTGREGDSILSDIALIRIDARLLCHASFPGGSRPMPPLVFTLPPRCGSDPPATSAIP
jgi:hypothetical protein